LVSWVLLLQLVVVFTSCVKFLELSIRVMLVVLDRIRVVQLRILLLVSVH
jgi:hypothetical protein